MDACPDNSTACLLGKLIELNQQILDGISAGNDQFNWDPASFIVTLAIGALAFLVACLTVFQGILAAGPGRVKAGKTAIGPWSKQSKSRFSWVELGVRSTAVVPVIELNRWNSVDFSWGLVPEHGDEADLSQFKEHGATWVNLLSFLGMTGVRWKRYKTIGTDYLPADVQGPPATAHMKSLITLAAIADDYCSISTANHTRFLTMTGLYTSVSIREHPVLGTVAAFEMHGSPRTANPFIFMHSGQTPKRDLQSLLNDETSSRTSALDITSIYALGEGHLNTGLGVCKLAQDSPAGIGADIDRIRATFLPEIAGGIGRTLVAMMFDKEKQRRTEATTTLAALIMAELPSRPRMVPKTLSNLKEAARRLVRGSMWESESSFPVHFECLLQNYLCVKDDGDISMVLSLVAWEEWDWLMTEHFDHRWSDLLDHQRQSIAKSSRVRWIDFENALLPADSTSLPWFVSQSSKMHVGFDCRQKAVALKRFMDRLCDDDQMEIEGESKIKFMFTALDTAALQVGFQAEVLLLDYYLLRQTKEDVACALMVLLKDISLPDERAGDAPDRLKGQRPYQSMTNRPSKPFKLKTLNEESYAEAYGLGALPAGFSIRNYGPESITLECSNTSLGSRSIGSTRSVVLTTPEAGPPEWAHLWYSRREKAHDRERITVLAEMMRYRALLCIAILDLCADSTVMMHEHFDRAMVRVI